MSAIKPRIEILKKVFRDVIKISPISVLITIVIYMFNGVFPALLANQTVYLIDEINLYFKQNSSINEVFTNAAIILMIYIFQGIFLYIHTITMNAGIYEKVVSANRVSISEKASRLSLLSAEDAKIMDLRKKADNCIDNEFIPYMFMNVLEVMKSSVTIISLGIVLVSYNFQFLLIALLSVIPYFIMIMIRGKEFYQLKSTQAANERKSQYLYELFTNKNSNKELRLSQSDEYIKNKWLNVRNIINEQLWGQKKKDAISLLLCDMLKLVGYSASILLSLKLVISEIITIGLFGACLNAFINMQEATKNFLIQLGLLPKISLFVKDYYEYLNLPEEENKTMKLNKLENGICLKKVCFSYPSAKTEAIKNINIEIHPNESICIIGENGSGKTTFSKLIMGLYQPDKGTITIEGRNISEYSNTDLFKHMSIVSQQPVEYHLTLRENVAISNLEQLNNDNEIKDALCKAGLGDLPSQLGGLEAFMGKNFDGVELSTGQWQRLALSRCIFKNGDFLVLDEPTSALDPMIETEVLKQFLALSRGKTSIIISHRVGLCRFVDRILVMKDGEIVQDGKHEDLINENGEYQRLYRSQQQWYQ